MDDNCFQLLARIEQRPEFRVTCVEIDGDHIATTQIDGDFMQFATNDTSNVEELALMTQPGQL
ncbi:MAG: hypothetical protein O6928_10860 [Gammaproteobacteria bacterium]|nr:hypothetical protein [Gammaproteobacteria bacterium]